MLFAETGGLLGGDQRRDVQAGNVAADEQQMQRGRHIPQDRIHQFHDLRGFFHEVKIVDHQDGEIRQRLIQGFRQGRTERAGIFGNSRQPDQVERRRGPLRQSGLESVEDIGAENGSVPVAFIELQPGHRKIRGTRELRGQRGFPVSGSRHQQG